MMGHGFVGEIEYELLASVEVGVDAAGEGREEGEELSGYEGRGGSGGGAADGVGVAAATRQRQPHTMVERMKGVHLKVDQAIREREARSEGDEEAGAHEPSPLGLRAGASGGGRSSSVTREKKRLREGKGAGA